MCIKNLKVFVVSFFLLLISAYFNQSFALMATGVAGWRATSGAERQEEREERVEARATLAEERYDARVTGIEKRIEVREEFRSRLQTIRDERKRKLAETLDQRLTNLNANRTAQMTEFLNRLEEILNKISDRAEGAKANGIDVSGVETAVATAKTAIATARAAVEAQAAKDYAAAITAESELKIVFSSQIQELQADLKATRDQVFAARDAVRAAGEELKKVIQ